MPYFLSSASHPASAPGTVTDLDASRGMCVRPRFTNSSRVISDPARPLALSATRCFSLALQMSANMSPPMPVIIGSTTESTAAAVTAASIALPPFCEHADRGGRGERLARRGDAVRRVHRRPAGHRRDALRLDVEPGAQAEQRGDRHGPPNECETYWISNSRIDIQLTVNRHSWRGAPCIGRRRRLGEGAALYATAFRAARRGPRHARVPRSSGVSMSGAGGASTSTYATRSADRPINALAPRSPVSATSSTNTDRANNTGMRLDAAIPRGNDRLLRLAPARHHGANHRRVDTGLVAERHHCRVDDGGERVDAAAQ